MSSEIEKAYFQRVREQSRSLKDEPPASLQEMFDRMAAVESSLGELAEPSKHSGRGDLDSHLSYLKRLRALDPGYRSFIT